MVMVPQRRPLLPAPQPSSGEHSRLPWQQSPGDEFWYSLPWLVAMAGYHGWLPWLVAMDDGWLPWLVAMDDDWLL